MAAILSVFPVQAPRAVPAAVRSACSTQQYGRESNLAHGREACAWADVIITGEGSIDSQTPYGKVPSGIAKLAQSQGKPTIAIGGTVTRDPHTVEALNETGIVATFGIAPGPADLTTLIANTERNVEITCAAIAGTLRVASATAVTAATSPCESV